jgi:hypothetical protein
MLVHNSAHHDDQSEHERPVWGRGVLASYVTVTPPAGRRDTDLTKTRMFSLRDFVLIVGGACGMYGLQISTQWGMRSDIRDLKTSVDGYQRQQGETNIVIQRQVDEARRQAALAIVNDAQTALKLAELKGFLEGSGLKGLPK